MCVCVCVCVCDRDGRFLESAAIQRDLLFTDFIIVTDVCSRVLVAFFTAKPSLIVCMYEINAHRDSAEYMSLNWLNLLYRPIQLIWRML